jgi:Bacteriophage HK97-gp10, putative tail-component
MVRFAVKGVEAMLARFFELDTRGEKAIEHALTKLGAEEMEEAQRRVPVATGDLRDSGMVHPPKWKANKAVSIELTFGGGQVTYAIPVHEDLEVFHRNGQAKYLESVLNESDYFWLSRVARDVRAELGL